MQTILITGVTSGFGLATAKVFHEMGYKVIGTGRRKERLEELAKQMENFTPLCFDISNREESFKNLEGLEVDILVNNAGLSLSLEPAYEAEVDNWETMIDTNIKGVLYATRALLPGMVERKKGHVINIGSVSGSYIYPDVNVYGGTKAFLTHFSQNLRSDLSGTRVRVTSIEPGLAESEFTTVRFKGDAQKAENLYKNTQPLTPSDIAECIRWIATLPAHVNINRVEVMPTCQTCSGFTIFREE